MGEGLAEQRAALEPLTPKRRAFVLAYVGKAAGNAAEAARCAKYAHPRSQGARLLTFVDVQSAIEALRAPGETKAIATMDELRALWTRWAREGQTERRDEHGELVRTPMETKDRLKASELLAKSQGGFVERREVSGPGGGPIEGGVKVTIAPDVAREIAREGDG